MQTQRYGLTTQPSAEGVAVGFIQPPAEDMQTGKTEISLTNNNINHVEYKIDSVPFIEELEKLYELNNKYFDILNICNINLYFDINFQNIFVKEHFIRFLKIPLKIY